MSKSTQLVYFEGAVTFGIIEMLLNKLRATREFNDAPKPVRKRLYGILVEALDNIHKYAAKMPGPPSQASGISKVLVTLAGEEFTVSTGNLVLNDDIGDLQFKLDRVNQLDDEELKSLYEEVINKESDIEDTGAGLGLITMAMRTCQDITYDFTALDEEHSFFVMKIKLNI